MSNIIKYKDYYGSVEFSSEDECFYGKIIGIDDLVTFEGSSVEELKKSFKEAVEDYLTTCEELEKEADKSYKGSFNVRIAPELHKMAVLIAKSQGKTLNSFVEEAIRQKVGSR